MAGGKRNSRLNELIIDAIRSAIVDGTIDIGSILRYGSDNLFLNARDIPDLQTVQALASAGIIYQQSTNGDLDGDGNLDISPLVQGGNSSFVTRIDYDYTSVDPAENPFSPSVEGYFNLFPQDVNGKLYISSFPPTLGSWNITVFATGLTITPPVPPTSPVITVQPPVSATVYEGRALVISVVATGAVGYQWRKGGVDIPGENSDTLLVPDFRYTDNGSYTCYVYNGGGYATTTACVASMFVPVAGQFTIINNSGDDVKYTDGVSGGFETTLPDGGIKDKNPFINNQYFEVVFKLNKKLTIKTYDNVGITIQTVVYNNTYYPWYYQTLFSMDISNGYSCLVEPI